MTSSRAAGKETKSSKGILEDDLISDNLITQRAKNSGTWETAPEETAAHGMCPDNAKVLPCSSRLPKALEFLSPSQQILYKT